MKRISMLNLAARAVATGLLLTVLSVAAAAQTGDAAVGGFFAPTPNSGDTVAGPVMKGPMGLTTNYFGVAVNGNCLPGTSCPGAPLPYNTANTLPVTSTFTLPSGDQYLINGSSSGSNNSNGGYLPFGEVFQVTFEGNVNGSNQSFDDDMIIDWYGAFETTYGYGYFGFDLSGAFDPNIGAYSSVIGCLNGGCQGPYGSPGLFNDGGATYIIDSSDGVFSFDETFEIRFGADSLQGSFIVLEQQTPLLPPNIFSFTPSSGKAGSTKVVIKGSNFTGATSVTFNNVAATSFTLKSDDVIFATVPCGATTGPIYVGAVGGLATSTANFTVTGSSCMATNTLP